MEFNTIPEELQSKVRIGILSALLDGEKDFKTLKTITGSTDGNLSVHISKLEKARYIDTKKTFVDKKPRTTCVLTDTGRSKYIAYVKLLIGDVMDLIEEEGEE